MWFYSDSQDVGLEAAIIKRKRNSSLVEWHCAENLAGLKHYTEATESCKGLVGEHSVDLRRCAVRHAGGDRRDNAGISSAKADGKSARRKSKVSWGREIRPGLVGPKVRLRSVADGQQVNIPAPFDERLTEGGTQGDSVSLVMVQV